MPDCGTCKGAGALWNAPGHYRVGCPACYGTGREPPARDTDAVARGIGVSPSVPESALSPGESGAVEAPEAPGARAPSGPPREARDARGPGGGSRSLPPAPDARDPADPGKPTLADLRGIWKDSGLTADQHGEWIRTGNLPTETDGRQK